MKFFKFFLKVVFFSLICNNIIFCADKSEDGWIELTKENIKCKVFGAKIDKMPIFNYYNCDIHKLEEIPSFLSDFIQKTIDTYIGSDKSNEYIFKQNSKDHGYNFYAYKIFNIKYNVFKNYELEKTYEQNTNLKEDNEYKILQNIVFHNSIIGEFKNFSLVNFLDKNFYDNILNKDYFKKVKFKDGTLSIDVDLEKLLEIVQRCYYFDYKDDIKERPFDTYSSSFDAANKKFFNDSYNNLYGFSDLYRAGIFVSSEYYKFPKYFNCEIYPLYESEFKDGKYNISIRYKINKVNCNEEYKFKGKLYPGLYYFYSDTIEDFTNYGVLLGNNKSVFDADTADSKCKKLLKEEKLFDFYKVIKSIKLNEITKYSIFFQNVVYFVKNYVIPYEEKLLFNELKKIEFKEYLNAKETNVEDFFYNKAFKIIKSKDSVFKDFYTLFFYDKTKNQITGVYFDDLNEKKELEMDIIKLFSLEKLINEFKKKYGEIDDAVNKALISTYTQIKVNEHLKAQFIKIIKDAKIIEDNFEEDFLKCKDFSISISEYITKFCSREIYKNELESEDKNTLKSFIEKLNNKDSLFKEIKEKTEALKIEDGYYMYFYNKELKSLISDMKNHSLKSLSSIFVDEIIKYEKENVIDKISQVDIKKYISDLQNKKEEYNKDDTITSLLNIKKNNENLKELTYKEEDKNKLKNSLLNYVNEKINNKITEIKTNVIKVFTEEQKKEIDNFKVIEDCNDYNSKLLEDVNKDGSIKKLLKDKLIAEGLKDDDIKDEDYKLTELETEFANKKKIIQDAEIAKLKKDDQDKLNEISKKIEDISNDIINEINKIDTKDKCKNYTYKEKANFENLINGELKKIAGYDDFIKKTTVDTKQSYEQIVKSKIDFNKIKTAYDAKFKEINVVKIEYVLVDEEKIEEKYKKEFNDFKNKAENKSFDSTKKYKELFDFIKIKNDKFKEIYLEDSENNLISIQNNEDAIEKNDITIHIKLVDSCYKKEKPKEEHEEDKNKDKHNEEDGEHKDDNENNDKIKEEDIEDYKNGVKNSKCCGCCNNKYCVKKSLSR